MTRMLINFIKIKQDNYIQQTACTLCYHLLNITDINFYSDLSKSKLLEGLLAVSLLVLERTEFYQSNISTT